MLDPLCHDRDDAVYRNVLANMADGVMTLDLTGRIVTFNLAAGRILGIDPQAVLDSSFAEAFIPEAHLESFNELVLKAVYDRELAHRQEIELELGGRARSLSLTTTFLRQEGAEGGTPLGVIVIVSDVTERRKRRKLERIFGEFVDPRIMERLLDRADLLDMAEQRRSMTVAFCDLAGFTSLVEGSSPSDLIEFVNGFIRLMTTPVVETHGVTDKFIGDAVMAFWGAPFTTEDPAIAACRCALGQRARLEQLRALAAGIGLPTATSPLDIRIGIASGQVVAGSIGTSGARSYTVIGDTVNVASRLEGANKQLGTGILVNEATFEAARGSFRFRSKGKLELRGRSKGETVFALEGAI